jgi:hypothetical protein
MRSFWLRSLVILLTLTLVSGNAHAELYLSSIQHEPCPEALDHHSGTHSTDRQHHKAADPACCCDCLGCVLALNLTPDLSFGPAFLAGTVRYGDENSILAGRALVPEPDPPRPSTLT